MKPGGFALPAVIIASVVMLGALVGSVAVVASIRASLVESYYVQLAKEAAESGIVRANSCLDENKMVVTWAGKTLGPNTDCAGTVLTSCPLTVRNASCGVIDNAEMRVTFSVSTPTGTGDSRQFTVTGTVDRLRRSNGASWKTYSYASRQLVVRQLDVGATRASHRWWYFGDKAALDFGTSGVAQAESVAVSCPSGCRSAEGITVASSRTGNLLFWTNGLTIWNREGKPMLNGGGLNADNSSTQAAAFFPIGGAGSSRYVVVTNNAVDNYAQEGDLYYSIVDMSRDNGLGEVVEKNIPLWPGVTDYTSEALAVAPKADGSGYWVVTFRPGTTNLLVFAFDTNGFVQGSVKEYSSGATISREAPGDDVGYGTINFNANYSQLVLMAGKHCLGSAVCSTRMGVVRLLDFNSATGIPTNKFAWDNSAIPFTDGSSNSGYSADFSPYERYVYVSNIYPGRLARYKISGALTSSDVASSGEFLGSTNDTALTTVHNGGGQVRRAPNGRMYIANMGTASVSYVDTPDAETTASMSLAQRQAAIGYMYAGQQLAPGTMSLFGLPQTMAWYTPMYISY